MVNNPAAISATGAWGLNIVTSVGIIMVNKQVMSGFGFKFATTLTGLHFLVTGMVGMITAALGYLPNKNVVPFWDLAWFSLVANTSIVGMNLSLMLNSVGFYQISKLSIIPTVCFFEAILNAKTFSKEVKASVVVVMVGVGVCTVTDLNVKLGGFIAACVAVVCTSLQQIFIGSLQKKYNVGSFDLLSQTAPIQAASLIVVGPLVDYLLFQKSILEYSMTAMAAVFIGMSCILAVGCNLSQYLCIGKFSAVTFQVLGHMKTVLVLLLGWILFRKDASLTMKNIGGMFMAVVGMVMYSWAVEKGKKDKMRDEVVAKAPTETPASQKDVDEEKLSLLAEEGERKSSEK